MKKLSLNVEAYLPTPLLYYSLPSWMKSEKTKSIQHSITLRLSRPLSGRWGWVGNLWTPLHEQQCWGVVLAPPRQHWQWTPKLVAQPGIHRGEWRSASRRGRSWGCRDGWQWWSRGHGARQIWEWYLWPEPPPAPLALAGLAHTVAASKGAPEECVRYFCLQQVGGLAGCVLQCIFTMCLLFFLFVFITWDFTWKISK